MVRKGKENFAVVLLGKSYSVLKNPQFRSLTSYRVQAGLETGPELLRRVPAAVRRIVSLTSQASQARSCYPYFLSMMRHFRGGIREFSVCLSLNRGSQVHFPKSQELSQKLYLQA